MGRIGILILVLAQWVAASAVSALPAPPQENLFGGFPSQQGFGDSRDKVTVSVVPNATRVAPGSDLIVAITFDHQPGWHIHTNDPIVPPELGDPADYIKTEFHVGSSNSTALVAHAGFTQWPQPHTVKVAFAGAPVDYQVFEGRAVAYLPVTVPQNAPLGTVQLTVRPVFQACDDRVCQQPTPQPPGPGDDPGTWQQYGYTIEIEIVEPASLASSGSTANSDLFNGFNPAVWNSIHAGKSPPKFVAFDLFGLQFRLDAGSTVGLVLLLLVAALGGLLLNFTPCVLPVIPIKIMSLSMTAGNRQRTLALGFAMFLGVIAFWMALGLAIATISGFTATNQLFQYPLFTISVGVIIAIMAIGMCGLFSIRLPQFVYIYNPTHESYHGSFMFGIMTAILSTPCTAPFMGAAAAWAATQTPVIILSVFFSIGFGMGVPYFILSAFPKLVDRMPRTGPASEVIKQVMGLLMLAAAVYFIGVGLSGVLVTPPEPPSRFYLWIVVAFVAAAGGWLTIRTIQITAKPVRRIAFGGLGTAVVIIAVVGGIYLTDKGPIDWIYYTPDRLATAQSEGKTVVMEFTAEWCLNCKALESTVLASPVVAKLLAEDNVAPIKVDITGNNKLGNEMLTKVNRRSIPLLVVFAPDGRETFKGDFYTVDQVVAAVREAQGKRIAARLP